MNVCVVTQVSVNSLCTEREPSWRVAEQQFAALADALVAGKRIMLYCRQGKNRSPIPAVTVLAPMLGGIRPAAAWVGSLRHLCCTYFCTSIPHSF
jgi:hypothetical protein